MPTKRKTQSPAAKTQDAVAILRADHARVDEMFKKFEKMKTNGEAKHALVQKICVELKVHMAVEDEIFYPAVRVAIRDQDLMDEADEEHAGAKHVIEQLEGMKPGDDHYDAKVTVLSEYIKHHVKEEHTDMFPKARKSKVDLRALGAAILERKQELAPDASARARFQEALAMAIPGM